MDVKDTVAIVTGSSSGIGSATAIALAKRGCHVVINYTANESGAKDTAARCRELGVETLIQKANVAEDSDCRAMVAAALEKFDRLDVLVNNAGTTKFCDHKNLDGLDKDDFLQIYSVNTVGAYQMTRAAEAALRRQPIAHVINIASFAGISGTGSSIAYSASKGALITMTKSLARVLGPQVRVNAICPGFIQGNWLVNGMGEDRYQQSLERLQRISPLSDTATPERVADSVLGLITGMDWTTGETIVVDGGSHLINAYMRL